MARLAYDISVVNIHFAKNGSSNGASFNQNNSRDKHGRNNRSGGNKTRSEDVAELPTELTLELPRDFNERFKTRSDKDYIDAIESFVYNHLTKRFQRECAHCQIWIGDDLDVVLKRIEDARAKREAESLLQASSLSDGASSVSSQSDYDDDEEL